MSKDLNSSEAVYGFAVWLSSRTKRIIMSSADDTAPTAELVKQFCAENNLPDVSEDWTSKLVWPSEEPEEVHCSFCDKTQDEVHKLIAGADVYICDECVDLCGQILNEGRPSRMELMEEIYEQVIKLNESITKANTDIVKDIYREGTKERTEGGGRVSLPPTPYLKIEDEYVRDDTKLFGENIREAYHIFKKFCFFGK